MPGRSSVIAYAASLLFAVMPLTAAARVPAEPVAHPPIHARPFATAAPTGYTPTQVRHAYGFDQLAPNGSGQVIGIVDAFDDPTAASDLEVFITQFGLPQLNGLPGQPACTVAAGPHPCFQKVFSQGKPRTNGSWALEISLDVQWAHAIAPGADILLVEARSNSFSNLFGAVSVAAGQAQVVSMSWGASDFLGESSFDSFFNVNGVTFTAASGDSGNGVLYPSSSPFVVGVGGTTLPLDAAGNLNGPETAWGGSGGGISANEAEPGYQLNYPIPPTGGHRGSPDVSYDADPASGFSVFDSTAFFGQT